MHLRNAVFLLQLGAYGECRFELLATDRRLRIGVH
jgi:hypothetical protein